MEKKFLKKTKNKKNPKTYFWYFIAKAMVWMFVLHHEVIRI